MLPISLASLRWPGVGMAGDGRLQLREIDRQFIDKFFVLVALDRLVGWTWCR
jgi:hypothetical protein